MSGYFAIGADRRITEWDEQAALLLGVSRADALGRPCSRVIGGRDHFGRTVCGPVCRASRALGDGSITGTARMLVSTAHRSRLRLACDLTALPTGGALGRLHWVDDSSPNLAYDLAGVAALTTRVASEPLQQGLRHALDFLLHATAADAGEAFLAEPHGRGMVRTCHRGCFARAFDQLLRFDPGEGFPGLVLSHGQPACSDHLPDDQRFLRAQVKRKGFNTYVCAPLTSRSDALGCLALAFRRSDVDLERVLNLLRWVGTPVGLVVETSLAHLREAASERLHGVESDPEQRLPRALHALLQEMVRISRADRGEWYMPWNGVELRARVPTSDDLPHCPVLRAEAVERCPAFQTGTTQLLHGRRDTWPVECRDTAHPGGAWCCIPVSCDGQSLGVIRLLYRHLRPSPPNENITLVEGLASLAAEKLRELRDQFARDHRLDIALHGRSRHAAATRESTGDPVPRRFPSTSTSARDGGTPLAIRCFGSLELSVGGVPVPPATIGRKRVLTLLGILVTGHDQPQCADALIERLWPGADPEVRRRQFHVLVHELRKLIESRGSGRDWRYVRNRGDRYTFSTQSPCWLDVREFRELLERGRKAETLRDETTAIECYESAVGLYRGDYMQDEPFAEWCWQTREQLREACLGALGRLAVVAGIGERWDRSAEWARRALTIDPLREEMHRALMYALWASGRRDEAVRQYTACAHLLRERLDLTPLPETEQLFARIRAASAPQPGH